MKYFEAFGEGGFHSAFMTTYAFGSLAFEDIPFPKLRGAGCRNIAVLADTGMVNQAFADFGPPRFAGTSYHLVKAAAPGAFHPKITVLLGEAKGRLMVGSANLTALGLGGNKEQVASITWSAETPENAKFFISALAYIRRYVPAEDQWFAISLQRAMRSSPWLRNDTFDPAFSTEGAETLNLLLDRPEISFLDQIVACIGNDPVECLVVVSPYWDAKLEGVARLKAGLGDPVTDILIENDAYGFPSSELSRFSDVALFDVSSNAGRFLHAKLIIAQGKEYDHVISGSMNCTFPALMGPAFYGNAEAGIYKRVARGSALEALGLSDYQVRRVENDLLKNLEQSFEEAATVAGSVDGGLLTLQAGKIEWIAPKKMPADPSFVQLYDRDGEALARIEVSGAAFGAQAIASDSQRPKYGILTFADTSTSAPIQVADLDYLAVTTLPPQKGRKKQLMDTLAEALHEDLALIEALNQLEGIEDDEKASHAIPKAKTKSQESAAQEYHVLSYDEFIRARTIANAQGKPFSLYLNSRHDRAVNLVSHCLNQMIGLVGPDLGEIEEKDIQALGAVDFRTTEPQSENDDQTNGNSSSGAARKTGTAPSQNLATAKKFQEAVTAFEKRSKALADKRISTSEMVRLRALMQIILSHAQPLSGSYSASQILPVYISDGHDWPRLIGRLLQQHFGATRALQNLAVENDEAEQQRVIEYLALSNWAAKAAHLAVMSNKKAASLRLPIERLMTSLVTQTQSILSLVEGDRAYFDELTVQLNERFERRLGLVKNPAA